MMRVGSVIVGAASFVAAHLVEVAAWQSWFNRGSTVPAWFLNSGRAVAFTMACVAVASALASASPRGGRREAAVRAGLVGAGAIVAMALVLFAIGPGTLFPLVVLIGALVLAVATVAGAAAGFLGRWAAS
jgi:uncharacterized membrane protein